MRHDLRNVTSGITKISENSGTADTSVNARRHKALRNPVNAKIALVSETGNRVKKARIIGARLDAIFAPNAQSVIDHNNAVLIAFPGGIGRAHINAGRL